MSVPNKIDLKREDRVGIKATRFSRVQRKNAGEYEISIEKKVRIKKMLFESIDYMV